MRKEATSKNFKAECYVCEVSCGCRKPTAGGLVLKLNGGWTLSHYADTDIFLGWMGLQPRYHRKTWDEFGKKELNALGSNVKAVDKVLRDYWAEEFPEDPIERIYVICFSEGSEHLHFHLIPRTKEVRVLIADSGGSTIAWDIHRIWRYRDLPDKYVVYLPRKHKNGSANKTEIKNENVEKLMQSLWVKISGAQAVGK